jgi:tetratricopeptide (TPR) repeat protein
MKKQMDDYIMDNENPYYNFNLGLEYEKINQKTSAISYFLRSAERAHDTDKTLSYESLIHMGICYDSQGKRGKTVLSCWRKAIALLPTRPEAYYHVARYHNWYSEYDLGYVFSSLGLEFANFDNDLQSTNYLKPGAYKSCLLFEKGLSGWWWGKVEESKNIFVDLKQNHIDNLPDYHKKLLNTYLKENMKVEL